MSISSDPAKLKRRGAIRYTWVLMLVLGASVVIGLLAGPLAGIAAFAALAPAFLPKPGRFFQLEEEPDREAKDEPEGGTGEDEAA